MYKTTIWLLKSKFIKSATPTRRKLCKIIIIYEPFSFKMCRLDFTDGSKP